MQVVRVTAQPAGVWGPQQVPEWLCHIRANRTRQWWRRGPVDVTMPIVTLASSAALQASKAARLSRHHCEASKEILPTSRLFECLYGHIFSVWSCAAAKKSYWGFELPYWPILAHKQTLVALHQWSGWPEPNSIDAAWVEASSKFPKNTSTPARRCALEVTLCLM